MTTKCFTEEQAELLAADELPAVEASVLVAHARQCSTCRTLLRDWKARLAYLASAGSILQKAAISKDDSTIFIASSVAEEEKRIADDKAPPPDSLKIPGYQILREIKRGGQGVVYEAFQGATKRIVAIKVMLEGSLARPASRNRFQREVEVVAALKHPNIIVLHDSGVVDDKPYFVMQWVQGRPLNRYVRGNGMPLREIVTLFRKVCDAVGFAHRRGIIHRDLKPSNILVDDHGEPFILDFGLAKIIEPMGSSRAKDRTLSEIGQIMGTLQYMSPEQTYGPDHVDMRTDVYSLGVIFYELITMKAPYTTEFELAAAFINIREAIPRRPSRINRKANSEIDAIVFKAMEKRQDQRYDSAAEMERDLSAWLRGEAVSAKSASSLYMLRKLAAKHIYVSTVLVTLLVTILSFSSISGYYYLQAREALAAQASSDRAVIRANRSVRQLLDENQFPAMRRLWLGWFLTEWHANRLAGAREIADSLQADSPERAAMRCMLDNEYTVERLRQDLPRESLPLADFVQGELAMKQRRWPEARKHFEAYLAVEGTQWLAPFVENRLTQLEEISSASKDQREAAK